uniref:COP9 signalosome complex subunit 6 n=1 Tax=Pyramimonas obovata TaxID=1411642 RepID=A0A7S0N1E2_9CHLO|mmetsp:Transcript_15935/g.34547  ORF Transcript_15935/g.34547 Transcript_15935/m.34547 type:complete len:298 (+) Transcript_15935:166-1059(+)|eukprot:CAMPEP_0118929178 /NCGR_PEP_ID=MMETSP1169-20130426/6249_1 /TAXON_ID=36882 /ORGANISM="Pyramimonas obovata, Strain CCMP722" /LENGTH=297 /DNA_ID=CAMNT_0006871319 /DNA_START=142 /DNA_END=1035 /DNA_ORIENTATION=-
MSVSNSSGLTFQLHPLVLINVSDHHTRVKAQAGVASRIVGGLLGVQTGRTVEITNSFELVTTGAGNDLAIDLAYLATKQEQYKKVFPTNDFIGWYSTGSELQPDVDIRIHKSLVEINESPIYMRLDPVITPASKDLPITLYESEVHIIEGVPSMIFVEASYNIETVEAERISVDQIARIMPSGSSSNADQLTSHLTGMYSAIKMLHDRINSITAYLQEVEAGTKPMDHQLARQISSLVRQLPTVDTKQFKQEFLMEYNDALLMVYLASMTKGTAAINDLADKFNTAFEKHSRRRALL